MSGRLQAMQQLSLRARGSHLSSLESLPLERNYVREWIVCGKQRILCQ